MFIVYSPEGKSFVGAVQNLPMLKVDPAKRINKVEENELSKLKADVGHSNTKQHAALNAYSETQSNSKGRLVVKVSEVMVSPVVDVQIHTPIEEAWRLMETHNIKHLPVLDNGELVGMCSQNDLLGRMIISKSGELEGVKPEQVADVMHVGVVTTGMDTDIRHVAQALTEYQIDALLIMSEYQKLIGIVTESDLIKRLAKEPPIELYT